MPKLEFELTPEEQANLDFLNKSRPQLMKLHQDQWVAIINGRLVGYDNSSENLSKRVRDEYPGQNVFLHHLTSEPERPLKLPL